MPSKLMCGFILKPQIKNKKKPYDSFFTKMPKSFGYYIMYTHFFKLQIFSGDIYFKYLRNSIIFRQFNLFVEYIRTLDQLSR